MEEFILKKNLEEIMRQKDDFQYAQLLNRLRIGEQLFMLKSLRSWYMEEVV
jgi:uncharacterized membrane-anchored protein